MIRGLFYTDIGTFQTYKRGWFRRLFDTHAVAIAALADQAGHLPEAHPEGVSNAAIDVQMSEDAIAFWIDFHKRAQEAADRAKALAGGSEAIAA